MTATHEAPGPAPRRQPYVPTRQLARDLLTKREGEVMDRVETFSGVLFSLRPVGGGTEWTVPHESVELLEPRHGAEEEC